MRAEYRERLPATLLGPIDEIEEAAGLEISVEDAAPPTDEGLIVERGTPMTVQVTKDSATIYIPTPEAFPEESFLHELLHIRRFWVEQVPMLQCPCSGVSLDNSLEHLIIVPAAVRYGGNPYPRWNSVFQAVLVEFRQLTDDQDILPQAKLAYASVQREVNDSSLVADWEAAISERGHLEAVRQFWNRLQSSLPSKREMLKLAFEELGANPLTCTIRILDARSRTEQTLGALDL